MLSIHRNRAGGWTLITFIFAALFTLSVSQAMSEEPAAAILLKETPETIVFDVETQQYAVVPSCRDSRSICY